MKLNNSSVNILMTEELVNLLRAKQFKKGSIRDRKRKYIKSILNKRQIEGTLEPIERILWATFVYDDYKEQIRYARNYFNDLRRRAGKEFREYLDKLNSGIVD
jgi:hypothetical protein